MKLLITSFILYLPIIISSKGTQAKAAKPAPAKPAKPVTANPNTPNPTPKDDPNLKTVTVQVNGTNYVDLECDYHHEINIKSAISIHTTNNYSRHTLGPDQIQSPLDATHVIKELCENRHICKFIPKTETFKKYDQTTQLYVPKFCNFGNCGQTLEIKYKCVDKFLSFLGEKVTETHLVTQQNDKGKLDISCYRRDYIEIMSVKFAKFNQENKDTLKTKAQELSKQIYTACNGKKTCTYTNAPDTNLGIAEVAYKCAEPTYSYYQYKNPITPGGNHGTYITLTNEMANFKMVCQNGLIKVLKASWEVDKKCFPHHNVFDRTDIVQNFCNGKGICTFTPASYDTINNASLKYLNFGGICNSEHYHKLKIEFNCIPYKVTDAKHSEFPTWINDYDIKIYEDNRVVECQDENHSIDFYSAYWGTDTENNKNPVCYNGVYLDFSERLQENFHGKKRFNLLLSDTPGDLTLIMPLLCNKILHRLKLRVGCRKYVEEQYTDEQIRQDNFLTTVTTRDMTKPIILPPTHDHAAKALTINDGTVVTIMSTFDPRSPMVIGIGTKIRLLIDVNAGKNTLTFYSDNQNTKKELGTNLLRFVTTVVVLGDAVTCSFEYQDENAGKFETFKHTHHNFTDVNVKDLVKMYTKIIPNEFKIYYGTMK